MPRFQPYGFFIDPPAPAPASPPKSRRFQPTKPAPADLSHLVLIACVAEKRAEASAAKDLYLSPWFLKARAWAESQPARWAILSAKYRLLFPDDVVAPYDQTLNNMPKIERNRWGSEVFAEIGELTPRPDKITILAGLNYREFLELRLRNAGFKVVVPMDGLRIGEQLSWLTNNL